MLNKVKLKYIYFYNVNTYDTMNDDKQKIQQR